MTLYAPKSRYFDSIGTPNERQMYLDLSAEIITLFGFEFVYFPRDIFNEDMLLGRSDAQFGRNATITMLIENPSGDTDISGQAEFYNKFGVKYTYDIQATVTQQAFWECFGEGYTPTKGDVFLMKNGLDGDKNLNIPWEVSDVDYLSLEMFGGLPGAYTLSARPYESKNEEFITNDPELQEIKNSFNSEGINSYNETPAIEDIIKDLQTFDMDNPFGRNF